MAGDDAARIRQGIETLTQSCHADWRSRAAISPSGQGAGAGSRRAGEESVVDAEFEDVDDPKRRAS